MPSARERITTRQVMLLLFITRVVPLTLAFPAMSRAEAPQDVWIGITSGTLISLPFTLGLVFLGLKFPGLTIVEYARQLLGSALGNLLSILLVLFLLHNAAYVVRALGEAFTVALMPETPILVFMITMMSLAAWSAQGGPEIIGRLADATAVPIFLTGLLVLGLPVQEMDLSRLRPLLSQGGSTVWNTTWTSGAFFMEFILLGFLVPYLDDEDHPLRSVALATGLSWVFMVWFSVALVAAFGPLASRLSLPAYSLARLISVAQFIERIEAITMVAWTLSSGIKLALLLWAAALATAQVCRLSSPRILVFPYAVLGVSLGILFFESQIDLTRYLASSSWAVYSFMTVGGTLVLIGGALLLQQVASRFAEGKR